jgi:hypothetical protein
MPDLDERLRLLADDGARLASAPGPEDAARRGRRRRRRLIGGCAAIVAVAMLAVGLGLRPLLGATPDHTVAPSPPPATPLPATTPQPALRVTSVAHPAGRLEVRGTLEGSTWRVVLRVGSDSDQPGTRIRIDRDFQNPRTAARKGEVVEAEGEESSDYPETEDAALAKASRRSPDPSIILSPAAAGAKWVEVLYRQDQSGGFTSKSRWILWDPLVTPKAAMVRIDPQRLDPKRGMVPLPPLYLRPIPGGPELSWNLVVFVLPRGTVVRKVTLLDQRGQVIGVAPTR